MEYALFKSLGLALLLGSLIGLERERRRQLPGKGEAKSFAGIRTFALVSLLGALSHTFSNEFFLMITGGFLVMLILAYYMGARDGHIGMTSEVGAIFVYIVGVMCSMEMYILATVVALVVTGILHFRTTLHSWAEKIKSEELVATMEFMIIAFVILPLLPNEAYGPYDFFNPYLIWLMVVFISGISFLSYIAIKLLGSKKGITLTGFFAGFISSTALALSFSSLSKKDEKTVNPYVLAILIAGTAMFVRVVVEVVVVNRELIEKLIVPMAAMAFTGILAALWIYSRKEKTPEAAGKSVREVESPFSVKPALKFAVFFSLILLGTKFAHDIFGDRGIYVTSLISGLLDVDAITISLAELAKEGSVTNQAAVYAITLGAMANTLSKGLIFVLFGGRKVAVRLMAIFMLMVGAGIVSFLFI